MQHYEGKFPHVEGDGEQESNQKFTKAQFPALTCSSIGNGYQLPTSCSPSHLVINNVL